MSKKTIQLKVNQSEVLILRCFKKITTILKEEDDFFNLYLTFHNKKNWKCMEMLTISTGKHHSLQLLTL